MGKISPKVKSLIRVLKFGTIFYSVLCVTFLLGLFKKVFQFSYDFARTREKLVPPIPRCPRIFFQIYLFFYMTSYMGFQYFTSSPRLHYFIKESGITERICIQLRTNAHHIRFEIKIAVSSLPLTNIK